MEGFLKIRLKPWLRRILTRLVAIVPAAVVAGAGIHILPEVCRPCGINLHFMLL